uniref:LIM zinc-binding domain-containing protein n=1 Tax=Oryzias latipes TaxID=8090 RepID=A0A3P9GZP0_ORYLA
LPKCSDVCFFCRKRVYVMERLSAEGKFFHRSCFQCDYCGTTLRLSSYAFDVEDGQRPPGAQFGQKAARNAGAHRAGELPTVPAAGGGAGGGARGDAG